MENKEQKEEILRELLEMAEKCAVGSGADRPEVKWLQKKFARMQRKYMLKNKSQVDGVLYERMEGHQPKTATECLKIRYWRTGRYTPINREQCLRLGRALELTDEEMLFLMQGYFDHSENVYDTQEKWSSASCVEKSRLLRQLGASYMAGMPEEELEVLNIRPGEREKYFRHIYFTDAFHYVTVSGEHSMEMLRKHITSTRYDSELRRQMRLQGEIPRKTMLRHLLILNAPMVSLETVNRQLDFLGYLPLSEDHTLTGGERLDSLVIRLLEGYREVYDPRQPRRSLCWLQEACREMDRLFVEMKRPRMRFMHFKALELQSVN